jgi:hypothetical protein
VIALPPDAPPWAIALAQQVAAEMDRLAIAVSRKHPDDSNQLITARQADITYRLRAGTATATYEAGDKGLRGKRRKGRSSTGWVLMLNREDCDRIWGAA